MRRLLLIVCLVVGAGSAMAQSSIGHVNSQALLDTLPSRKAALKDFQEFEYSGMIEPQEMEADLNSAIQVYQGKENTLSPVMMKIEQEKLQKKQAALVARDESFQQELQAYSQELNAPILAMVQEAVQNVADKNKLDYVLDATTVLVANGKDITDEVITELLKLDAVSSASN
jgi:outer membrane protein